MYKCMLWELETGIDVFIVFTLLDFSKNSHTIRLYKNLW